MGVKFAGSRHIDDRRRRRMVTESDFTKAGLQGKNPQAGYLKIRRYDPEMKEAPRSPISSLIPESALLIWGYCTAIPVLALVLVTVSWFAPPRIDSSWLILLDVETGHTWRFLRGLTFLTCASLCWLISWFRSASVRDFDGCFKTWYWSGWIFCLFSFFAGSDAHLILSRKIAAFTEIQLPHFHTLIWVVPVLTLLSEPFRCFVREMWHCRRSWVQIWGCSLTAYLFLWAKMESYNPSSPLAADTASAISAIASVLCTAFLLSALLSQVHYVMYVSSDPVPKRPSWIFQIIKTGFWLLLQKTKGLVGSGLQRAGTQIHKLIAILQAHSKQRAAQKQAKCRKQLESNDPATITEQPAKTAAAATTRKKRSTATAKKAPVTKTKTTSTKTARKAAASSSAEISEEAPPDNSATLSNQSAPEDEPAIEETTKTRSTKARVRVKAKPVAEQTKPEPTKTAEQAPAAMSPQAAEVPREEPVSAKPVAAEPPASVPMPTPVSEAYDDENDDESDQEGGLSSADLKGLSKKERRRLRKQNREQQRSKAG